MADELAGVQRQLDAADEGRRAAEAELARVRQEGYQARKAARGDRKVELKAEMSDLMAKFKDAAEKIPEGEIRLNSGPDIPLTREQIKVLGQMARNVVHQGALTIEEMVDAVRNGDFYYDHGYDHTAAGGGTGNGPAVVTSVVTPEEATARLTQTQGDDTAKPTLEEGGASGVKGSVTFTEGERPVVRLIAGRADVSTLLHESAHIWRRTISDADLAVVERHFGPLGSVPSEEGFARGFERYLRDGQAPTPELRGVFERFKGWLSDIYARLKGSPVEADVHPEVRALFDRMIGGEEEAGAAESRPASISRVRSAEGSASTTIRPSQVLHYTPSEGGASTGAGASPTKGIV